MALRSLTEAVLWLDLAAGTLKKPFRSDRVAVERSIFVVEIAVH